MSTKIVKSLQLNTGAFMPVIGLGTSQFENKGGVATANLSGTREAVEYAIDIGCRHFDTAYNYRNEKEVGQAIKNKIAQGVVKREDLFVTTKLFNNFHRSEYVQRGLQLSLADLQLDYVDMYLIHCPHSVIYVNDETGFPRDSDGKLLFDRDVDLADTWKAMEKLVDLGLARAIGVSSFNTDELRHIMKDCRIKPANNQIESHAYLMQPELFKFCQENGIVVTAFSPIGSPGRWNKGQEELVLSTDPVVLKVAERTGKSPSQVLIRYQIERDRIPIPRSTNPVHIKQNFDVFDFEFSPQDLAELDGLDRNLRFFPDNITQRSK